MLTFLKWIQCKGWPLTCGDQIILVQHSEYHCCWWPGSLCHQDISTHDINYEEYVSSCLTWGKTSTTCVMSVWRNDKNCSYIFMFPVKNSACEGLSHLSMDLCKTLALWSIPGEFNHAMIFTYPYSARLLHSHSPWWLWMLEAAVRDMTWFGIMLMWLVI